MTLMTAAALLGALICALATVGSTLVRRSAPVLMRAPRTAVAVLTATLTGWLLAVAAVGPLLAWTGSSPTGLMPGRVGEVCQRCLDAASPLTAGPELDGTVPVILLILLPVLLGALVTASLLRVQRRRRTAAQQACRSLFGGAHRTELLGHRVTVVPGPAATAFALPRGACGIVISQPLLETLTDQELHAVLSHEAAHLRQRHHLIATLIAGVARPLAWVPLVRTIADAVPHYLEMAADNAARHETGTPALARALLKLGEQPGPSAAAPHLEGVALHAVGTDRIRLLVSPPSTLRGAVPALVIVLAVAALMLSSAAIHLPYLQAVLSGCFR